MKLRGVFSPFVLGLVLCASAGPGAALTLGRLQGQAYIGQTLDVKVQVQWEAAEAVDASCFTAEVLHGDTVQDASKFTLRLEPLAGTGSPAGLLRIQSQVSIDEPVVTVTVRGGCQSKSLRRYVLLADVPPGPASAVPALPVSTLGAPSVAQVQQTMVGAALPAASTRASTASARTQEAAPSPSARSVRPPRAARTAQEGSVLVAADSLAAPKAPAVAAEPAPVRKAQRPAGSNERAGSKSRLKLDVLDLSIDYSPVLKSSNELQAIPEVDAEKRMQAQLWWKQLNASPEDILREAAQAQQLSRDIQALRDITSSNQKAVAELQGQLRRAQDERFANPLVYALMAALVACIGALIWMWRRSPRAHHHWSEGLADPQDSQVSELHDQDSVLVPVAELAELSEHVPPPQRVSEVDIDIDLSPAPTMVRPSPVVVPPAPVAAASAGPDAALDPPAAGPKVLRTHDPRAAARPRDFQHSVSSDIRFIDSEEVVDVREQAEFFLSLGQHDKAVEVLTSRIAQCGESSPLVCLDLLKILHMLGRKPDYEFMRAEFHIWFTGRIPEFGHFEETGRALEEYPHVLDRIVSLWPDVRALEFIEDCLFNREGEIDGVQFDICAYRELLLLHAIAKHIVRTTDKVVSSEPIRVPPRAKVVPEREDAALATPRPVTHRAGAHLRGAWTRPDRVEPPVERDPEADIDTKGAPLGGAMQVPPNLVSPDAPASLDINIDSANGTVTDFGFLSRRSS